jgi:hypothetical protein
MAKRNKTLKDWSRVDWSTEAENYPGDNNVQLGGILRIADAVEKMASSYDQLRRDKEWYQREYNSQREEIRHLKNSRAAYMAHLTRLRNKIADSDV